MVTRRRAVAVLSAALVTTTPPLQAHDETPQYGGVVRAVRDTAYEIVSVERGLLIHVDDHGNPVPVAGVVGKLILSGGAERSEVPLAAAGENLMLAAGARWAAGQKATAVFSMPSRGSVVVAFGAR
jgi:hypothetical protein